MKGRNPTGEASEHTPRNTRRVPRGPLSHDQVKDEQEKIARVYLDLGYTRRHVGQILNQSRQTTYNRISAEGLRPVGL